MSETARTEATSMDLVPNLLRLFGWDYDYCGHTIYRGIFIAWDEDHDGRILRWIDGLPEPERARLLVASESKAELRLLWSGTPPSGIDDGDSVRVMYDSWVVRESRYVLGVDAEGVLLGGCLKAKEIHAKKTRAPEHISAEAAVRQSTPEPPAVQRTAEKWAQAQLASLRKRGAETKADYLRMVDDLSPMSTDKTHPLSQIPQEYWTELKRLIDTMGG